MSELSRQSHCRLCGKQRGSISADYTVMSAKRRKYSSGRYATITNPKKNWQGMKTQTSIFGDHKSTNKSRTTSVQEHKAVDWLLSEAVKCVTIKGIYTKETVWLK